MSQSTVFALLKVNRTINVSNFPSLMHLELAILSQIGDLGIALWSVIHLSRSAIPPLNRRLGH
jgi:hypothetical protein